MHPNLTLVREKVIAANPSILDFKADRDDFAFSCELVQPKFYWTKLPETASESIERTTFENRLKYKLQERMRAIQDEAAIGRPIRLADVLQAMDDAAKGDLQQIRENLIATYDKWNLLDDDLSRQSQETIDFLAEILK